jgi:hypothetical protein
MLKVLAKLIAVKRGRPVFELENINYRHRKEKYFTEP